MGCWEYNYSRDATKSFEWELQAPFKTGANGWQLPGDDSCSAHPLRNVFPFARNMNYAKKKVPISVESGQHKTTIYVKRTVRAIVLVQEPKLFGSVSISLIFLFLG